MFGSIMPFIALADTSCTTDGSSQVYFDGTSNPTGHFYTNGTEHSCTTFLNSLTAFHGGTLIISGSTVNDGTYIIDNSWTSLTGDYYVTTPVITAADLGQTITFTHVTGGGGGGGNCGLGCGGIPTAYTANFSSSTAQGSAVSALSDLRAFLMPVIIDLIILLVSLIAIGTGVWYLRRKFFRDGYNAGLIYSAGEIKKVKDKYF